MKARICFLSTNDFGFGGSEDLWIGCAALLARSGHSVAASVRPWEPRPRSLAELEAAGCTMLWHETPSSAADIADILDFNPSLIVVSQGFQVEGLDWLERIVNAKIPFLLINQCVHEAGWLQMDEPTIERMKRLHGEAKELLFVSEGNLHLYNRMMGYDHPRAGVVRNPFKVAYSAAPAWPAGETLKLATVGRLECYHKGYDLIFEVLRNPKWHDRPIELNVYGDGPHRALLQRLAVRSRFPRVAFHGQVTDIETVWRNNHVLLQPSRLEGLPLSIVEAMLCGRPVVATDVAGHAEVITDGITGFLAPAPTPALLDAALERLFLARDVLKAMGAAARRRIHELVPENPCEVLSRKILDINQSLPPTPPNAPSRRAYVRCIPRSPRRATDHHAHLYYAESGTYSEAARLATDYPAGTDVQLRFANIKGAVRFDPGTRPGRFLIRSLRTTTDDGTVQEIPAAMLPQVLTASGNCRIEASDASGCTALSDGSDPILQLNPNFTPKKTGFTLDVFIRCQ